MAAFADGKADALIATDVAARGIHVDNVACVLHYDPPEDAKAYLHRSGRTARAGAAGVIVSLVRTDDAKATRSIQRKLGLPTEVGQPGALDAPRGKADAPNGKVKSRRTDALNGKVKSHRTDAPNGKVKSRRSDAPSGTVTFFDSRRGFGFIAVPGRDDLFVHYSQISGRSTLDRGQTVSFKIGPGRKGDEARNVKVLSAA